MINFKTILGYRNKLFFASQLQKIKPMLQDYIDITDSHQTLQRLYLNIKNKVQDKLGKGTNELSWYCKHYLQNFDQLSDFINEKGQTYQILSLLSEYQKLNKNKKKLYPLNDNVTYNKLKQFIIDTNNNYQLKKFKAPKNAEKIFVPECRNYNVYKCQVGNKNIQKQLQNITTIGFDENGQKKYYTCWCVVNGTKQWGYLTQSPWNYYYYITTSDNKPYILMNFGDHGQINNIHDQTFSNWNDELLNIVHYLMEKDDYNPKDNIDQQGQIFNTKFNQMDYMQKIYNHLIDISSLNKLNEYNQYYLYEDTQNDKKVIVHNDQIIYFYDVNDLHRVGKEKLNVNIIKLLIENDQFDIIGILIQDKIVQHQDKEMFEQCIKFLIKDIDRFIYLCKNNFIDKDSYIFKDRIKSIYKNKSQLSKKQLEKLQEQL